MRRFVCLLTVAALAASAHAATLELWLSTNNLVAPQTPGNLVLPAGYSGKVYLWARTPGMWHTQDTIWTFKNGDTAPWRYTDWVGDVWKGISLNASTTIGFSGTVANPVNLSQLRWLTESDFGWANGDQFNVATLDGRGCGGAQAPLPGTSGPARFDSAQATDVTDEDVPGFLYTRLGSITITSAPAGATFYMTVGTGTIARRNGDPYDLVQFGVGDAPVRAAQVGAVSTSPDLMVVPEPGCVLMFVAAALATARRNRL